MASDGKAPEDKRLMKAIKAGDINKFMQALEDGASVNYTKLSPSGFCITYYQPIHCAAEYNRLEMARILLYRGADLRHFDYIAEADCKLMCADELAAFKGHKLMAEFLRLYKRKQWRGTIAGLLTFGLGSLVVRASTKLSLRDWSEHGRN